MANRHPRKQPGHLPGFFVFTRIHHIIPNTHTIMIRSIRNQLSPSTPLNPRHYLKIFAWISIGALSALVFSEALLPLLGGAALAALLLRNGDIVEIQNAGPSRSRTRSSFGQMGERRFATA